jgi:hypothetical protein
MIPSMLTALRVATPLIVLLACQRDVRDPRVGSIELVLEPVPRASAPDPAPDLDHVRELVARRLAGLRAPVEVAGPFEAATRRLVGRRLAMTLDDKPIAAPLLEAPIPGGRIQVTLGEYATSHALADTIVLVLKAGEPLPLALRLLQERRVPPRAR